MERKFIFGVPKHVLSCIDKYMDGLFLKLQQWIGQTCASVICVLNWCKIIWNVVQGGSHWADPVWLTGR